MPGALILERRSAAEDNVRVGRGLAGTDHELRSGGHALKFFVGDECQVRQPGLDELVEQAGEHGLEGGDSESERQVRDRGTGRYRQTGVADNYEVCVSQPAHGTCEVCVDDSCAFHSASTVSGVGSAPWAP